MNCGLWRDLGMMRQPGHRFFFTSAEIELIEGEQNQAGSTAVEERRAPAAKATILIACIGNIFLGDDGFGVEVARRMQARPERAGVRVVDFGIRGFDLAYALQDGYEASVASLSTWVTRKLDFVLMPAGDGGADR